MTELTIKLNPITARLVADLIDYDKSKLEHAQSVDPFKDNKYLIDACDEFLKAYEEAKK